MTPPYIEINEFNSKCYYKDREMTILHREDGPAYESVDGYKSWWLNGVNYTKEQFENKIEDRNIKDRNLKLFAIGVLNILANHEEWNADVVDKIADSSVDFGVANFTADGNFNVL